MVAAADISKIDALQSAYVLALDSMDMDGWLGCFAEDGTYLCQTLESFSEGLPVGYMWDDRYGRLKDRVKTVTEVWAGPAEEYQPRHFCQRLSAKAGADGLIETVSNFVVFYTTNRGDSRVLATGKYLDSIRVGPACAQFVSRKAILDQTVVPRYLVYPL